MASTLSIGNVEIMALIDATAKAPCSALFPSQSKDQWAPYCDYLEDDCSNLPLTIPSFVIRSSGKTLLVDSGIGAKDRPFFHNGRLPQALAEAGVTPQEIDIVFVTHIHIDHVGWHTMAKDGAWVPTFPNATYVFARTEHEFFTSREQAENPAFPWVRDCVLPLEGQANVELVDGEHGLTDDLTLMPAPGHTPAHSALGIMSGGEAAVLIGDVCHSPVQTMETSWAPVFDMNPALAAQTRSNLMERIEREQLTVIAGHFAHPGFGRLVRIDGKRTWQVL